MSRKTLAQISVLALLLVVFLAVPASAQAGGMCGGAYIVDAGDTLNTIAAKCGITVSAITTANPGVTDPLRAGQTLTLSNTSSSKGGVSSNIVSSDNTYNNASNCCANVSYSPPVTYSGGTYTVQYGDTFVALANRFGVSTYELWGVNPQILDMNYLYAGQVVYIPAADGRAGYTNAEPEPISYGHVPAGTVYGSVRLVNKSSSKDIYVSLQGSTRDGIKVIYEYPVDGSLTVKVPVGDYSYVAWANERQFVGYFHLGKQNDHVLTFYNREVISQ